MKHAVVYFNPDNMISSGINGTVETISEFYKIGKTLMLDSSDNDEDGRPYTIKGLKIFDKVDNLIYQAGDCTSKYEP